MIIKPRIRGFMCTTSHPEGCAANVQQQADWVRQQAAINNPPTKVLIIGASTGYGLSSRIITAFGSGAATLGVLLEKPGVERRTATAGWYNTAAFHQLAEKSGLQALSINADAFSDEAKNKVMEAISKYWGTVDLVVYSLAAPRRKDANSDNVWQSVLKPIGAEVSDKSLDTDRGEIKQVTLPPATEEEIAATVKVMGGEDWQTWINLLRDNNHLAEGCKTIAYSYIGDRITWPIYGNATIGVAKKDLDRAAAELSQSLKPIGGDAYVGVLGAAMTQSSAAIPVLPLYMTLLMRQLKQRGDWRDCTQQVYSLLDDSLYGTNPSVDEVGRLRADAHELQPELQRQLEGLWQQVDNSNFNELGDFTGFRQEFLKLFGFGIEGIDYERDISTVVNISGMID